MNFKELSLKETISDIKSTAQYCSDEDYIYWTAITTPTRAKRAIAIMLEHFDTKNRILDVGSSQGLTIGYTAQVFPDIEGIDIDNQANITARKRLNKLGLEKTKLHLYNGRKLPFKDNSFEGVISTEVFEHVDNRDMFAKELFRVLKPKGKLIISAPNKLFPLECEFHLPFLSYLPKGLADKYVRLSGKGKSYDGVNHPTYSQFRNTVSKYFTVNDVTFDLLKNYQKYYLGEERGIVIPMISNILKAGELLRKTPFSFVSSIINFTIRNASAGWFFVCTKK